MAAGERTDDPERIETKNQRRDRLKPEEDFIQAVRQGCYKNRDQVVCVSCCEKSAKLLALMG